MLRRIVASFLLSLFTLLFLPLMVLVGIYDAFFDPDFYGGEFSDFAYEVVIEKFPLVVVNENQPPPITEYDLRGILKDVLTRDDFQALVDNFIAQVNDEIPDDQGVITLTFDLGWFIDKDDFVVDKAADIIISDMSGCDGDPNFEGAFPDCVPEDVSIIDFKNGIKVALDREFFGDLPNEVKMNLNIPDNFSGSVSDLVSDFSKIVFLILILTLLLILLLVSLLIFKPVMRVVKWNFKALVGGNGLVLVFISLLFLFPSELFFVEDLSLYGDISRFFFDTLAMSMLKYALPLFLVSVTVWIFAMMKERNNKKDNES